MSSLREDWCLLDATQESLRDHMLEVHRLRAERDALRTELASMRACFEAADPLRSELRERAKRARQAALIEAAEICDRHANEWPQTIAAVLRAIANEKGND